MKLKIILTGMIMLLLSPVFASENRVKIADNFYVDTDSIIKHDPNYVTGDFIQTNVKKRIKLRKPAYIKIRVGAFCNLEQNNNVKKLEYPVYKYYNKHDKLIKEDNIHTYWAKHFPGGNPGIMLAEYDEFGELYFDTLCGYKK